MKFKKIIISVILVLIIMIIFICFYKGQDNKENTDTNINQSDNQTIKEIKQDTGMIANEELYEIQVEYDGKKVLNIKPEIQYKIAFAGIIKKEIPKLEEIDNIFENNHPKDTGIWIDATSRKEFLNLIKENTNNEYSITDEGYLKINKEVNSNDEDKSLKEMIESGKKYIVTISGTYFEADQVTGEILDNFYEELDPYQASKIVGKNNNVIIFLSTNNEKVLTSKEILSELTAFSK